MGDYVIVSGSDESVGAGACVCVHVCAGACACVRLCAGGRASFFLFSSAVIIYALGWD